MAIGDSRYRVYATFQFRLVCCGRRDRPWMRDRASDGLYPRTRSRAAARTAEVLAGSTLPGPDGQCHRLPVPRDLLQGITAPTLRAEVRPRNRSCQVTVLERHRAQDRALRLAAG